MSLKGDPLVVVLYDRLTEAVVPHLAPPGGATAAPVRTATVHDRFEVVLDQYDHAWEGEGGIFLRGSVQPPLHGAIQFFPDAIAGPLRTALKGQISTQPPPKRR